MKNLGKDELNKIEVEVSSLDDTKISPKKEEKKEEKKVEFIETNKEMEQEIDPTLRNLIDNYKRELIVKYNESWKSIK